jgi:hypothetical protein
MRFEQMLADALREEADSRPVDVDDLWERTQASLDERATAPRRRLPVLAAAAAAVMVVAAGGAALGQLFAPEDPPLTTAEGEPAEGGVDEEFTCPEQITHDWTRPETVTDDYFVASLRGGPAEQARIRDAARYEYDEQGDRASLRFGNADGSLATVSEFRREGDEWVRFRTDLCTGKDGSIAVPLDDEWELRPRGARADAQERGAAGVSGAGVLVDSRSYYDNAGLVRTRTLHAVPCDQRGMCLTSTEDAEASTSIATLGTGRRLWDLSWIFMPFEERPVSRPYGFWALYDAVPTELGRLSATLRDGSTVDAEIYDNPTGSGGTLYLLLAPFGEVESLTVEYPQPVVGTAPPPETYLPEDLGGHRADLHP